MPPLVIKKSKTKIKTFSGDLPLYTRFKVLWIGESWEFCLGIALNVETSCSITI